MHVVLCNCSPRQSQAIARRVVEERLAACVNVLSGVTSYYLWEGALEADTEDTLLIKVARDRVGALSARLRELHDYDTPEILVLPVDLEQSDRAYVDWVRHVSGGAS